MSMPIKACGGAEFFRGACRDRYLGRRDCADCEPLKPTPEGDGRTISTETEQPVAVEQPDSEPAADSESSPSDDEPARPRAPRGAKKR